MSRLADLLSPVDGRRPVDETTLTGYFNVDVQREPTANPSRTALHPGAPEADGTGTWILTAVREQLGLKLNARKTRVDALIVDHAERPTED